MTERFRFTCARGFIDSYSPQSRLCIWVHTRHFEDTHQWHPPPQPQPQGFNKHFHSPLPFLQVVRNVEVLVSVLSAAKPPTSTASKANHGPPWPAWATSGIPTLGPAALGSSWGPSGPAEAHMKSAITPPGPRWRTSWAPVPPPRPRRGPEWAPHKLFNKSAHLAQKYLFLCAFAIFQRPKKNNKQGNIFIKSGPQEESQRTHIY